jgi:hypothetical protein
MRTAFACFSLLAGLFFGFAAFVFSGGIPLDRLPHTTVTFTGGIAINAAVLVGSFLGAGLLFVGIGLVALFGRRSES